MPWPEPVPLPQTGAGWPGGTGPGPAPGIRQNTIGQERGNLAQGVSGLIRLAGPQDPGKFSAESDAHSDS